MKSAESRRAIHEKTYEMTSRNHERFENRKKRALRIIAAHKVTKSRLLIKIQTLRSDIESKLKSEMNMSTETLKNFENAEVRMISIEENRNN